ncbi:MAG: glycosyltransferase [Candidatus Omnitrophica bacterium]|nr:glycosyltransferase [Candidatus Omnitrophota bacterium]
MNEPLYAKIDLHCHSWASDRPSLWLMQRLGCPESFTSPDGVREAAMLRDMDFVTITDHNTIDGVQEIQHLDNVIIGEEVTTYFPGDVKVHVVCLDITPEQHREIENVRVDIYEFVRYLNENNIFHFCAHPLHKVNGRLTWDLFEKLILMFKSFEILNGTRLRRLNQSVQNVLRRLTPEEIQRLSQKHGIAPVGDRPWEKIMVGGTDDHSGLFVGSCYTEVEVDSVTRAGLLDGLRKGRTRVHGDSDGILSLSHQVNSIAYQYYRSKIGPDSSELLQILGRIYERNRPFKIPSHLRFRKGLKKLLKYFWRPKGSKINLIEEVREVIRNSTSFRSLFEEGLLTREEYNAHVFNLSSEVLDQMFVQVFEKPQLLHYFIVFAPTILASYFMVCRNLHAERDLIQESERYVGLDRKSKVAWFTDSYINMDGVSKTCRMFHDAARIRGKDLTLITCHPSQSDEHAGVANFSPIHQFPTPGYDKVMLYIPSILKVLRFAEQHDFDAVVLSTPGPVGLIGLICAKLMNLPVYGIYHTDLPRIALQVSSDPMFSELALVATRMFYRQADRVLSPSKWYLEDIQNLGIPLKHTAIMERWIDTNVFNPERRIEEYWEENAECNMLFVGRVSKDKNLDLLIELYEDLAPKYENFVLHCVGDGPYFEEMRIKTASLPRFIMTGAKFKDELAAAYASSDLFVYPGLLDTFGNVVVEAQASGLPCVVMNEGGPQELIEPGQTGIVARTNREFIEAAEQFLRNPQRRRDMGMRAARYAAQRFAEETIFTNFWDVVTAPLSDDASHAEFHFNFNRGKEENLLELKNAT